VNFAELLEQERHVVVRSAVVGDLLLRSRPLSTHSESRSVYCDCSFR
jgi:hypothetical protein